MTLLACARLRVRRKSRKSSCVCSAIRSSACDTRLAQSLAACSAAGRIRRAACSCACACTHGRHSPERVLRAYVWECDGGLTLHMKNCSAKMHYARDARGPAQAVQVRSASGARYADEPSHSDKGETAISSARQQWSTAASRERSHWSPTHANVASAIAARATNRMDPGDRPGTIAHLRHELRQERHEFDGVTTASTQHRCQVYHGSTAMYRSRSRSRRRPARTTCPAPTSITGRCRVWRRRIAAAGRRCSGRARQPSGSGIRSTSPAPARTCLTPVALRLSMRSRELETKFHQMKRCHRACAAEQHTCAVRRRAP